jgi:hypothetical protein
MRRNLFFFVFFAFAMCFCALTSQASAQATRTWVSGVGDDANPCSRTAPCKTFAGAISRTADCGEIDALDPGGFGTVTITKGVKIDGGGGEAGQVASILATSGSPGVTINNTSVNCTFNVLRNLDINGANSGGIGVNVINGAKLSLENVDIENFTQQCVNFQPSSRMNLVMYSTNLENCQGNALIANNSSGVGFTRINIEKSTIHRSNGIGVQALNSTEVMIHNSMINNNVVGGVSSEAGTTAVTIDLSVISNNGGFGIHAGNGGVMRVSNTSISLNGGTGMLADGGGQILTWGNNWVDGNSPNGGRTSPPIAPQ